jgi:hypothetical protein
VISLISSCRLLEEFLDEDMHDMHFEQGGENASVARLVRSITRGANDSSPSRSKKAGARPGSPGVGCRGDDVGGGVGDGNIEKPLQPERQPSAVDPCESSDSLPKTTCRIEDIFFWALVGAALARGAHCTLHLALHCTATRATSSATSLVGDGWRAPRSLRLFPCTPSLGPISSAPRASAP